MEIANLWQQLQSLLEPYDHHVTSASNNTRTWGRGIQEKGEREGRRQANPDTDQEHIRKCQRNIRWLALALALWDSLFGVHWMHKFLEHLSRIASTAQAKPPSDHVMSCMAWISAETRSISSELTSDPWPWDGDPPQTEVWRYDEVWRYGIMQKLMQHDANSMDSEWNWTTWTTRNGIWSAKLRTTS